jgi:hydroxyacylglutathione hydrolase
MCRGEGEMVPNKLISNERIVVLQAQLGKWDNLNHLLVCVESKEAVIVDPFDGRYWYDVCKNNGWNLNQIWLTHTHWDHSKGVKEAKQLLGDQVQIYSHAFERQRGWDAAVDHEWTHEANSHVTLNCGTLTFEAHCTPGHTPGHTTFIGEGVVISGDCLFLGRCGRTDLFGGDPKSQRATLRYLRTIMHTLSDETMVLPGHQYTLADGQTPTTMRLEEVLNTNEALLALDNDEDWRALPFLAFDDTMAENARKKRAKQP